jgi:type IV secretory pathway component VirB8
MTDHEISHFRKRKYERWIARRSAHRPARGVLRIFGAKRDTAMLFVLAFFFLVVLLCVAVVFLGPLVVK